MNEPPTRVLLVEDNPSDAKLVQIELEKTEPGRWEITVAERLSSAMSLLALHTYDVAVLDLGLPDSLGMDGIRMVRERFPELPIVALTGRDDQIDIDAIRRGAQDYIPKSYLHGELISRKILYAIERHQAEIDLLRRERQNRALLIAVPDMIFHVQRDGTILEYIPGDSTQPPLPPEEFLDKPFAKIVPEPVARTCMCRIALALETGQTEVFEYEIDDQFFEARVVACGEDDVLLITRDISVRKHTERELHEHTDQLVQARVHLERQAIELQLRTHDLEVAQKNAERASQAKSEFLANMSHEIRTPMTAILGYADVLTEHNRRPECLQAIDTIKRNGEYLLDLINDILDLSKIEADKLTVERISCSPADLIKEVCSLMRVRAEAKGLQIEVDFPNRLPETIHTDPTRLRQILINLVGNAVKFTEKGIVRIVVRLVEESMSPTLEIDVIDTGIGMTSQQMEKLFQPFTQADSSTTRKFGGTGLGLTISKRLIEMLGGQVTVESEAGVGSRFVVSIATGSLATARFINPNQVGSAGGMTTSSDPRSHQQLNYRILLVEDGLDNQRLIAHILKKHGADVVTAENGEIAIQQVVAAEEADQRFDVVLMDMQMPVLDGYGATRRLREMGQTLPIIALTADAMSGAREKCLEAGCDDYTTKPIKRAELLGKIVDMVASSVATSAGR